MSDLNTWLKELDRHIQEADRLLLSVNQLNAFLADLLRHPGCPFGGITLQIKPGTPFAGVEAGVAMDGAPAEVRSAGELDTFGTHARISLWTRPVSIRPSPEEMSKIGDCFVRLVGAFWKGDLRDAVSWLISKQNSERRQLIEQDFVVYPLRGGLFLNGPFRPAIDQNGGIPLNDRSDFGVAAGPYHDCIGRHDLYSSADWAAMW